jgi:uncharacterized RDD family membrane protein YckC
MDWSLLRRRVGAYVVDIAVLFAVLGPGGWLIQRLLGWAPTTGPEIWWTLLVNFSVPTWIYFTIADASPSGATLGKRWLRLRVSRQDGGRTAPMQALGRTAARLLPWELVHISAFALEKQPGEFSIVQGVGLAFANALMLAYLACAAWTHGRRSIHDVLAGTVVGAAA